MGTHALLDAGAENSDVSAIFNGPAKNFMDAPTSPDTNKSVSVLR